MATVRGALKIDGVSKVDIQADVKDFKVTYDPKKVTVEQMLKKLADAKEPAKKKS